MAEATVSFLLDRLSIWLQQEKELLGGLEQEVKYIQGEMGQMRAFLRVADAKQETDPQLKEWVSQVQEVSYDIEDVLDEYMLRFAHPRANGLLGHIKRISGSIKKSKTRHQIASEIQTIKITLENVSKSQKRFGDLYAIMDRGSTSSSHVGRSCDDGRGDALLLEEADVVGIEKPKKQLVEWLLLANSGLKIISVVGMGGLGKTTLVKKVYDDPSVKVNFDHHVWISVSGSFKVENLLQNIIKQLVNEMNQPPPLGLEGMKAVEMKEFIYKFLQHNNYIIVLDDVWNIHAWEDIKYAFPKTGTPGRGCIIITTRINSIGETTCMETNGHVYTLRPLPIEEAEKLFHKKAFRGNSCPPHLKEIFKSVLKKCEGLPLAIVVIGGLLATKNNSIIEWAMFNRNLGHELDDENLERMVKILSAIVYDLQYHLKSCFLYLSIFPEDDLIGKWRVIRLWIAEGFVQAKQGKTLEEVAEGYLNELLNRNLIQIAKITHDGRPTKFRIHDLLREYIVLKSREQNIAVINSGEETRWVDKIRRLAIHSSINHTHQSSKFKYLRSLLLMGSIDSNLELILKRVLRGGCKLLKVLDLKGAPIETIPDEVFRLYLLKNLSLKDTKVNVIPRSIENLQNLETLNLKRSKVTALPIEIIKLHRLRHLLLYNTELHFYPPFHNIKSFKAPYEIGRLLFLQKLGFIDADAVDGIKIVVEIGKLTQLRKLGVANLRREDGLEFCSSLEKLTNLYTLTICSVEESEVMDINYPLCPSSLAFLQTLNLRGYLEKMPQWISSLYGLSFLYLGWSRLKEDPLQYLEDLPNLVGLVLHSAYEGEGLSFKVGKFQKLKNLWMIRLGGLKWIRIEKGSMPLVEEVMMRDCKLVAEVPAGMEDLACLQKVEFTDMEDEFVARLEDEKRKKGDDWKLANIVYVGNFMANGKWIARRL